MRVVIDTNVVVSAALKDRDPEAVLIHVVEQPQFEWVATRIVSVSQFKRLFLPEPPAS